MTHEKKNQTREKTLRTISEAKALLEQLNNEDIEKDNFLSSQHKFSPDRAIESKDEDLLNRSEFAENFANALSSWSEKDSLVVSLYGNWGDGKTSTKNMILKAIQEKHLSQVEVLEFNPWQWAHSDNIYRSFFNELKRLLSKNKKTNSALIKNLEKYSEYLEIGQDVLSATDNNSKNIGTVLSLVLAFSSTKTEGWTSNILFGLGILALLITNLNWVISGILRILKANQKSYTLEELKKSISDELQKRDKTFLVIIDDIDRLNPEEIKEIFTLIKGNADFPKLIFLTMFQRDIAERSLEVNGIYSGRDYLEKIIQVGIDLPYVPEDGIHDIFFKRLDKALYLYGGDKHFEEGRWVQLFNEGISGYFKNLRDVNRFLSSFLFQLGSLYKNHSLEVNFIDLVGIEALRIYEPDIYKLFFDNKDILTSSPSSGWSKHDEEERKSRILSILDKSTDGNKDHVKQVLEVLFPNIRNAWSNFQVSVSNEHFIHLNVCHPDRFNRYFSFFFTKKDFSEYEFQQFLEATGDEQKLKSIFKSYELQNRLNEFVSKLEHYKQLVPAANANPFLKSIFELGDIVDSESKGFLDTSAFTTLWRVIIWFLKKKEFNETRNEVYKKAVSETNGVALPIFSLFDEYQRRKEGQYSDLYSMRADEKDEAKILLLNKINANKDSNVFKNSSQIYRLLSTWKHLEPVEAENWIIDYTKSDEHLLALCRKLLFKSSSSSGYETKISYNLSVHYLKEFFSDPKIILTRISNLKDKYDLPENETLFKAIKRANAELDNPEKYQNRIHDYEDE